MSLISSTPFPDYADTQDARFLAILNQPDSLPSMSTTISCELVSFECIDRHDSWSFNNQLSSTFSTTLKSLSTVFEFLLPYQRAGNVECTASININTKCTSISSFYLKSSSKSYSNFLFVPQSLHHQNTKRSSDKDFSLGPILKEEILRFNIICNSTQSDFLTHLNT